MISLDDLYVQVQEQYKLNWIAGKKGGVHPVGWVHLVEDPKIIQFLWSNDLALTLGVGFQSEQALMDCIIRLVQRNCVGLIINTGEYINEIPESIIHYCDQHNFPLLTLPWEIHVNLFIKDISIRCQQATINDEKIASYFIKGFKNEEKLDQYREELSEYFDVNNDFQITVIDVLKKDETEIQKQKIQARLRFYFGNINCKYLFFWYEDHLILITNSLPLASLYSMCEKMIHVSKSKLGNLPIRIGIGSSLHDLKSTAKNYKRAKAALEYAHRFEQELAIFSNIGFYQILFSVEDKDILNDYYHECLNPLIEYDKKHHSQLELTFEYYLKYNGAISIIAQELFTHRNTINYRIQKIKTLLDSDLDDSQELFKYSLAYMVKDKEEE